MSQAARKRSPAEAECQHSSNSKRRRSRSASEANSTQANASPPAARVSLPPPSAHDLDQMNFHIGLQEFGTQLQHAANAIFPSDQISRYTQVDVILLCWEDEDPNLPVSLEIEELADVFAKLYGFNVEKWSIPSEDCHIRVQTKILQFLEHSDSTHLKIVYYGGHGRLTNHGQSAWTSRRNSLKDRCPTVKWSGIQNTLEEARSDVLILLDCCASGVSNTDEGNGVTELVAACAYNAIANGVGPFSFTHALISKLKLLIKLPFFTVGYLYNAIFAEVQGWRFEDSRYKKAPVHLVFSQCNPRPRSIRLAKIRQIPEGAATDISKVPPLGRPQQVLVEDKQSQSATDSSPESAISSVENLGSSSASPASCLSSFCEPQNYPRIMFSIRILETVKAQDLSTEFFVDWLRDIPVSTCAIRVEAGFVSDSSILIISIPASMVAYLPYNPAVTLLGSIRSTNLLSVQGSDHSTAPIISSPKITHGLGGSRQAVRHDWRSISPDPPQSYSGREDSHSTQAVRGSPEPTEGTGTVITSPARGNLRSLGPQSKSLSHYILYGLKGKGGRDISRSE